MLGIGRYGPRGGDDAGVGRSSGDRATIAADTRAAHPDGWVDDPERDAWVVLNEVAGVGPVAFARLIGRFGTAQGVLDAAAGAGGMAALGGAMVDEDGGQAPLAGATARAIVDAARDPELVLARVRRSGV